MVDAVEMAYTDPKPELLSVTEAMRRGLCTDFLGDLCLNATMDIVVNELGLEWDPLAGETARWQAGYMSVMWLNQMALLEDTILEDTHLMLWPDHSFDPSIGEMKS
jgi:hypothetical protein